MLILEGPLERQKVITHWLHELVANEVTVNQDNFLHNLLNYEIQVIQEGLVFQINQPWWS